VVKMPTCPMCGKKMTQDEDDFDVEFGLWWCDECGINTDSFRYREAMERKKEYDRNWR